MQLIPGSNCSNGVMASDLPTTLPALSTPKYFPYPDFRAIFVSVSFDKLKM